MMLIVECRVVRYLPPQTGTR